MLMLKLNYFEEFQTRATAIGHHAKTFYFISDVVPC